MRPARRDRPAATDLLGAAGRRPGARGAAARGRAAAAGRAGAAAAGATARGAAAAARATRSARARARGAAVLLHALLLLGAGHADALARQSAAIGGAAAAG